MPRTVLGPVFFEGERDLREGRRENPWSMFGIQGLAVIGTASTETEGRRRGERVGGGRKREKGKGKGVAWI